MLSLSICTHADAYDRDMRGDFGEFNPARCQWQCDAGVLEAMGTLVRRAIVRRTLPHGGCHIRLASTLPPTATLIGQRVLGAKPSQGLTR